MPEKIHGQIKAPNKLGAEKAGVRKRLPKYYPGKPGGAYLAPKSFSFSEKLSYSSLSAAIRSRTD